MALCRHSRSLCRTTKSRPSSPIFARHGAIVGAGQRPRRELPAFGALSIESPMLKFPLPLLPVLNPSTPTSRRSSPAVRASAIVVPGIATFVVVAIWFAFYLPCRLYAASHQHAMSEARDALPSCSSPSAQLAARVERRWATVCRSNHSAVHRRGGVRRHPPGHDAASPCRNHQSDPPSSRRRVCRDQSRHRRRTGRLGDRARDRPGILLHAGMHPRADGYGHHFSPRRHARCDPRFP